MTEDLAHLFRAAVLAIGGFTLGFSIYIIVQYLRGQFRFNHVLRAEKHARYLFALLCSYTLLLCVLIAVISTRAIQGDPITWRLPIATVAFPLGTWALYNLVREQR